MTKFELCRQISKSRVKAHRKVPGAHLNQGFTNHYPAAGRFLRIYKATNTTSLSLKFPLKETCQASQKVYWQWHIHIQAVSGFTARDGARERGKLGPPALHIALKEGEDMWCISFQQSSSIKWVILFHWEQQNEKGKRIAWQTQSLTKKLKNRLIAQQLRVNILYNSVF